MKAEEKVVQSNYGAGEIQALAKQLTTCYQDLDAYFQGVWVCQEGLEAVQEMIGEIIETLTGKYSDGYDSDSEL